MANILIKIVFADRDAVPIGLLNQVTDDIEKIIFYQERLLLEDFLSNTEYEIDEVTSDAIRHRFRQMRGKSLLLRSTARGSVELHTVLGAIALWVLANTLGESFKSGWNESAVNSKLKKYFRSRLDGCAKGIRVGILSIHSSTTKAYTRIREAVFEGLKERRLRSNAHFPWIPTQVTIEKLESGDQRIVVTVVCETTTPPTHSVLLDEDQKGKSGHD